MIATLVLVFVAALVILGAVWVIVGKLPLAPTQSTDTDMPGIVVYDSGGRITAESLSQVTFDTAVRGYRMDQVDAVITELIAQLSQTKTNSNPNAVQPQADELAHRPLTGVPSGEGSLNESTAPTPAMHQPAQPPAVSRESGKSRSVVDLALSIDVPAPASTVWEAVVDWPSQGEWMLLTKVSVSGGDGRSLGSELAAFTGIGPIGFLDTMTITGWNPPYSCDVLHTGAVVRGTGSMRVVAAGDDSSVFHWQESLELPWGWLGRVGWTLGGWLFIIGVKQSLARFARVAASGPHLTPGS